MTVRLSLPEDNPDHALLARSAGWHIDEDLWWTRHMRAGDMKIHSASHFGFTTEDFEPGEPEKDRVFVRSAKQALDYDKGIVTPYGWAA